MIILREDGKEARTSGWKEWTPEDIEIQGYLDMKREFQGEAMIQTKRIGDVQRENSRLFWENDALKKENREVKQKLMALQAKYDMKFGGEVA